MPYKSVDILAVEDDLETQEVFKQVLSKSGFKVVIAGKVSDAIFKVNNQKFSCIILDLNLDGGSGTKLIDYLRNPSSKSSFNFECPIILVSGSLDPKTIKEVGHKVQAILSKPMKTEDLLMKIKGLINPDGSSKSLASPGQRDMPAFIHDMANTVGTASLLIEKIRNNINDKKTPEEQIVDIDRMEVLLEKMGVLLEGQRK